MTTLGGKNRVYEELRSHSQIREVVNPAVVQPAPEPPASGADLPLAEKGLYKLQLQNYIDTLTLIQGGNQ